MMMKTTTMKTRADVAAELQRARRWLLLAEISCALLAAIGVAIAAASCHL